MKLYKVIGNLQSKGTEYQGAGLLSGILDEAVTSDCKDEVETIKSRVQGKLIEYLNQCREEGTVFRYFLPGDSTD
jgi:hypothetical protein